MSNLHAIVKSGRIVLDEPTDLPDGTVVELGVYSPGTIAHDAVGFLPKELQPAIATIYNLWRAIRDGTADMAAFCRGQLLSDLEPFLQDPLLVAHAIRALAAMHALMSAPATDIRRQDLVALELALFDARLPPLGAPLPAVGKHVRINDDADGSGSLAQGKVARVVEHTKDSYGVVDVILVELLKGPTPEMINVNLVRLDLYADEFSTIEA